MSKADKEAAMADKLMKNADKMLSQIDNSFIVKERGHVVRQMPTFRPEEISLGKVLGIGGFGIVHEITKFTLDDEPSERGDNGKKQHSSNSEKQATADGPLQETAAPTDGNNPLPEEDAPPDASAPARPDSEAKSLNSTDETQVHYKITKARQIMERRCTKNGVGRYALKRLHGSLTKLERARGMLDMAVEAKYLSVVWHPNIIKMRGMGSGPLVDKDFFIVLDRLFMTLDQKINEWHKVLKKASGAFLGLGKRPVALKELLIDRMTVAYDLAAAFFYLHENRLVYRDIKPENIGFDFRGDVKVFDFGLCKSLSAKLKAREGYGYRLTGRAGSLPYMAPEVVRMETYSVSCDVYSFAVLLWEILCLKQAWKGTSPTEFVERVVVSHERLPVPKTIPPLTRLMIPEAWHKDPQSRPDMKRVAILIRGDLNDLTADDKIRQRTAHMADRSNHSLDQMMMGDGAPSYDDDDHLKE